MASNLLAGAPFFFDNRLLPTAEANFITKKTTGGEDKRGEQEGWGLNATGESSLLWEANFPTVEREGIRRDVRALLKIKCWSKSAGKDGDKYEWGHFCGGSPGFLLEGGGM